MKNIDSSADINELSKKIDILAEKLDLLFSDVYTIKYKTMVDLESDLDVCKDATKFINYNNQIINEDMQILHKRIEYITDCTNKEMTVQTSITRSLTNQIEALSIVTSHIQETVTEIINNKFDVSNYKHIDLKGIKHDRIT